MSGVDWNSTLSTSFSSIWNPHFQNLNIFVNFWSFMLDTFSPMALYSYIFWCLVVGVYVIGGGLYAIIDFFDLAPGSKIQPARKPTPEQYWHCVRQIMKNYVFIIFPLSFGNYILLPWVGAPFELAKFPNLSSVVFHVLLFFLIEDLLQYVLHRMLHWPSIYPYIHKVHHEHPAPFGLTAAYAHWAEVLILAIPTYSGPVALAPHLFTIYAWILLRELDSVITHSGYEFGWQRFVERIVPFYGGAKFHDYHHYAFNCNYASRLTFIDKAFGTYRESRMGPTFSSRDEGKAD